MYLVRKRILKRFKFLYFKGNNVKMTLRTRKKSHKNIGNIFCRTTYYFLTTIAALIVNLWLSFRVCIFYWQLLEAYPYTVEYILEQNLFFIKLETKGQINKYCWLLYTLFNCIRREFIMLNSYDCVLNISFKILLYFSISVWIVRLYFSCYLQTYYESQINILSNIPKSTWNFFSLIWLKQSRDHSILMFVSHRSINSLSLFSS